MAVLPAPYQPLNLGHAQSATIRVERVERGELLTDEHSKQPGRIWPMARIYGERIDAKDARRYFDLTSRILLAGLVTYLEQAGAFGRIVKITAYGVLNSRRFTWQAE